MPTQTLNEFNSQYSQWLKDKPISSGAPGSCDIDANKKFAYYCGDDKCYGLERDEFLNTQVGCALVPGVGYFRRRRGYLADPCHNFGTTDKAMDDGDSTFDMGTDPKLNIVGWKDDIGVYGCENCPEKQKRLYLSGDCDGGLIDSYGDECETHDCDMCDLKKTNNVHSSVTADISIMDKNDELDDAYYVSSLTDCPSDFTREFIGNGDGHDNAIVSDEAPAIGRAEVNDGKESLVKICYLNKERFKDDNIAKCSLEHTKGSTGYRNCPKGYCVSETPYESLSEQDKLTVNPTDGKVKRLNTNGVDFLEMACSNPLVYEDHTHPMRKHCIFYSHIMPSSFDRVAEQICSVTPEEIEQLNDSNNRTIRNRIKNRISNTLCSNYLRKNIQQTSSDLRKICEKAVKNKGQCSSDEDSNCSRYRDKKEECISNCGEDAWKPGNPEWILTDLGEDLKDICPCHYPQEYHDWYKKTNYSGDGDDGIQSSMSLQIKPECYMPECQKTLLYDTSGVSGGCPNLQVCANQITNNIRVSGNGQMVHDELSNDSQMACNFTSNMSEPSGDVPNLTDPSQHTGDTSGEPADGGHSDDDTTTDDVSKDLTEGSKSFVYVYAIIVIAVILILFIFMRLIN